MSIRDILKCVEALNQLLASGSGKYDKYATIRMVLDVLNKYAYDCDCWIGYSTEHHEYQVYKLIPVSDEKGS